MAIIDNIPFLKLVFEYVSFCKKCKHRNICKYVETTEKFMLKKPVQDEKVKPGLPLRKSYYCVKRGT